MNKIRNQSIEKFLEELASKKPTPGGGAVAALAGAMAAGLVEMVVNLTKTEELKKLGTQAMRIRQDLLRLADEDVAAFDEVMVAYKSKSKQRIRQALSYAIAVPQKTEALSRKVEKLAKLLLIKGNQNALSDAKSAVYLAIAAQKSARENIEINRCMLANL
jgi:formiminotetrahydrofolate cyclodeaminase